MSREELSPWADITGTCSTCGLSQELGLSPTDIEAAVAGLRLVTLTIDNGVTLFPAFQLVDVEAVDGVREVLNILRTGVDDPRTWLQWAAG